MPTSVASTDSPLTSTHFYEAYLDVPAVGEHVACRMIEEIDVKVAVINAMGWNFSGQDNAATYIEFYQASSFCR
ncbi:MAG: hypothetical protein KAR40_08735 [Candidatus Sabulitectum sp.]|nr:hypothetical protein [Candidatus Sabulitectum sp.]